MNSNMRSVFGVLEGKTVNLRIMEKEDLPLISKWFNDPEYGGEYEPLEQITMKELEKWHDGSRPNEEWFIVETKNKRKIGHIFHTASGQGFEIGYRLIPSERNKGYGTEAVSILIDFLFLSKNIVRIQAKSNPRNAASQRVLEKAGFKKEGVIRKDVFIRGQWQDGVLYSILREEWNAPRTLTKRSERLVKDHSRPGLG
jgi:RimJ/RimL family protein N-acetyltransferase